MIKTIAFTAAVLLAGTYMAQAKTMCHTTHGEDDSYRLIDGKRCWYKGEKGRDKDTLFWKVSKKVPRTKVAPAPISAAPVPAPQVQTVDVYRLLVTGDVADNPPSPGAAENLPIVPALQPVPLALASLWLGLPVPPHLQLMPEPGEWPAPPPPQVTAPQATAKAAPQQPLRGALLNGTILTLLLAGLGLPIGFGVTALQRHVTKRGSAKIPAHWVPIQLEMKGAGSARYSALHT